MLRKDFLKIISIPELKSLKYTDLIDVGFDREVCDNFLKVSDAIWIYKGEPTKERSHALLKQGGHSNGYLNLPIVLEYPNMCEIFAFFMSQEIKKSFPDFNKIDFEKKGVVTGSASSATTFSFLVAKFLNARHLTMEKIEKGSKKEQVCRGRVSENEIVHIADELSTTGTTPFAVQGAIEKVHEYTVQFTNPISIFAKRFKGNEVNGRQIISVVDYSEIQTYEVDKGEECPYCKVGSKAIPPKNPIENWLELKKE